MIYFSDIVALVLIAGCFVLLLVRGVNLTINVQHKYGAPEYVKVDDLYNQEGEPNDKEERVTIDSILKEVNNIMLDREDESDE